MTSPIETWEDGILRERWDMDARTFTAWNADGSVVTGTPRSFTTEENARADYRVALEAAQANEASLTSQARTAIAELKDTIAAANLIIAKANNTVGPADTKDLAREMKDLARQVIRITKLFLGDLDDADTGAA